MRCLQGSQVLQFAVIDQECHLTWRASSRLFSRRCGPQRQDKGNAQAWFKAALVYVSICFRVPTPGVVDPFMARAIPSACGGGGRRRPVLEDRLPWEGGGGSYERDILRKDNPYLLYKLQLSELRHSLCTTLHPDESCGLLTSGLVPRGQEDVLAL